MSGGSSGGSGSGGGISGGVGGAGVNKFVWARPGMIWWPGEVVDKRAFTDEMKALFVPSKKGAVPHAIVRYFDEEGFSVIKKEAEIRIHALLDEKTKSDLIKKGMEKAPKNERDKFRQDVIKVEAEVSGRSKELTSVWFDKLLEKKKEEKRQSLVSSVVKQIFTRPEEKQRVRGQIVIAPATRTPTQNNSNKPPATPSSTSSTPGRSRFSCPHPGCSFSTERMGTLQSHSKSHTISPSTSTSSITPARRVGSSPLGKRSPRKSSSPVKSHPPSKRGRPAAGSGRGRKEGKAKVPNNIKKEAILEGWSDGEEDEDDKMAVLGEEPPPTLKLFDTCTSSCVDEKSGKLIKQEDGDEASSPGKKGAPVKKSMDDVFQELLRQTKPEFGWVDEQQKGLNIKKKPEEPEDEVESSEVSSDEEMRDEYIMRTRTVKEDVQENVDRKEEEDKESETVGSEMKDEEEAVDGEVTTKNKERKVGETKNKDKEDSIVTETTVEDIKKSKAEGEKLDLDIEDKGEESEEISFEKSLGALSAEESTEPEDDPNESLEMKSSSFVVNVDLSNNKPNVVEAIGKKGLAEKEIIPVETETKVECPKLASPGPPLLSAEATVEVAAAATTLPPATTTVTVATPTSAPPPAVPSAAASLPPTNSDILDSPRPPRPTAAVKPTTTTTTIGSPGTVGGVVVSGGEMIEDNVEKGAAIVQVQTASGSSAGGSPPVLEPEQIVHVVPVENSDGTLTYMFLSVDQSSQPRIALDHTDQQAATIVNGNEMEALYVEKGADPALYSALQQQTLGEEQQYVLLQQGSNVGGDTPWTLEQLQELLQANGLATGPAGNTSSSTSSGGPGGNPELGTTSGNE